ncbi:MAG: aminoacyl-tRNA deacylase [Phototrophicales bacterium]
MSKKLNSMRILEQHQIPYEVFEYSDSIKDAEEVAEVLGVPYFTVFKTLVVQAVDRPDIKHPYLAIIPSEKQLDLKKMAATAGVKKVRMASQKDAERLTGLQVGGISALALLQKQWDVYLDQSATQLQQIIISAGQRGVQLRVPVIPLLRVIRAKIADISTE